MQLADCVCMGAAQGIVKVIDVIWWRWVNAIGLKYKFWLILQYRLRTIEGSKCLTTPSTRSRLISLHC